MFFPSTFCFPLRKASVMGAFPAFQCLLPWGWIKAEDFPRQRGTWMAGREGEAKGRWQGPTEGASSPDVPRKLCGVSPPSSSCGGRAVPLGRDRPVHHSLAASLQEIWRWFPPDCHPQVSLRISADHVAFVVRSCLSREIPLMPSFCETGIYRGSLPRAALCRPAKASLSSERLHSPLALPWNKT